MPKKVVNIRKKRSLNAYESAGEEEILTAEPPPKVERSEEVKREKKNTCECCCYCQSWSYASPELVVLVACGSFNPITTMHLRMMEIARDAVEKTWSFSQSQSQSQIEVFASTSTDSLSPSSTSSPSLFNPRRQIVVAGVMSPVSDGYAKAGLASAESRCRLARLACSTTSDWIAVDSWEAAQPNWTPTREVLKHLKARLTRISRRLNAEAGISVRTDSPQVSKEDDFEDPRFGETIGSQETTGSSNNTASLQHSGSATNAWLSAHLCAVREVVAKAEARQSSLCHCGRKPTDTSVDAPTVFPSVRVKLVCGADLLESFVTTNLWSEEDITTLVRDYGIVCISRPGSNAARLLYEMDILSQYEQNVILATEWSQNGLSATVVRRALARGQSVRYLVPDAALEEIYSRGLYGAARPSRPSLLLLVPPSTSALQTTPLSSVQTAEQVESPKNVPTQSSLKSAEEVEVEYRQPQHPSTCLAEDIKVVGPKSEPTVQTSEKGTNPLYIETRSHSVQTRLSSIPSPQTPGTLSTSATSRTSGRETPLILHRVIVDPSTKHGSSEGGLPAILPLLKQCTRCGSQRVRLVLVERPSVPTSQTLPIPSPIPSQIPVVHTPRIHRQHHHHNHSDSQPVPTTSPKISEAKKEEPRILLLGQQARQQRWMPSERSMTQPITLPSSQNSSKERPQKDIIATPVKSFERTSRADNSRRTCTHHHHPHGVTSQIPPPKFHSNTPRHQHHHLETLEVMNSSGSGGHSLPRDPRSGPRQQSFRHEHHHHHFHHNKPTSGIIKSSSQDTPSTSNQRWMTTATTKAFQNVPVKQRTRRREKQKVGPPEPRLEGDGAAAPTSSSLKGGILVSLPHSQTHLRPRHLLSPPAMESQPIPPALLVPRSRRSLTTTNSTYTPPIPSTTTPISLSQPMLAQTSTTPGRQPRRTYDEVDYLLYNLCLNIESAL
ncbi:unnamed protein product [Hymenolepis diminuta]|uniref:Cytidyltransferase-like domain-containing protein n=2 Tax=Hymenolepis diminuta TaxID=6216 RepID=A0A564YPQ9_HYMDI|nr:unnamed protein product [Hymenolepis diminuta]